MAAPYSYGDFAAPAGSESSRLRYMRRLKALEIQRDASWRPMWKLVGEYIDPWLTKAFWTDENLARRNEKMLDGYAKWMCDKASNGAMAGMANPTRPWFALAVRDRALSQLEVVKQYLSDAADTIRRVYAQSNIYNVLHVGIRNWLAFGTAAVHLERDPQDVIRAYSWPIGTYCLANSSRLQVDTIFRYVNMTVEQIVDEFGFKNCSKYVRQLYMNQNYDTFVKIVHAITPNRNFNPYQEPQYIGPDGMGWKSCWFEYDTGEDHAHDGLLAERGLKKFPVLAPRYDVVGENVYGYGPGVYALGDAIALQEMQKRLANMADKTTKPPMVGPMSLSKQAISIVSGHTTFLDVGPGGQKFEPAFTIPPQSIEQAMAAIEMYRKNIGRYFNEDVWSFLVNRDREVGPQSMTAREIDERARQNMLQMGPATERAQTEYFGPLIEWTYYDLLDQGLMPPMPDELKGVDFQIEYISVLAQAQKVATTAALGQVVDFTGVVMQTITPEAADNINTDRLVRRYAESLGVEPDITEDEEIVAQKREARAKRVASQEAVAEANANADTLNKLSGAKVGTADSSNVLNRILSEYTGGGVLRGNP